MNQFKNNEQKMLESLYSSDYKLKFQECINSLKLKYNLKDKIIIEYVNKQIDDFVPLLEHVFVTNNLHEIESSKLTSLYQFYQEGIRIKNVIKYLPNIELFECNIPENLYNFLISINNIYEIGPFLFQSVKNLLVFNISLKNIKLRYDKLFYLDDPVEWYKKINGNIEQFFSEVKYDDKYLFSLLQRISQFNENYDPILQT